MKKIILAVAFVAIASLPSYAQSKKELKAQVQNLRSQLDKTQKYNEALVFENGALKKRLELIREYIITATDNLPAVVAPDTGAKASVTSVPSTDRGTTTTTVPRSSSSSSRKSSYTGSSYSGSSGRTIYTGPRGGRYYINSKGNKVYIKR